MKTRKKAAPSLNFEQLYTGYSKSVENAMDLLDAALKTYSDHPAVALGLCELGQEELGKSLSFLSAFYFLGHDADWTCFWNSWRDHQLKAHRAFLYELFSPLRMIIDPHGPTRMEGFSARPNIKHEKEAAFYVEYLPSAGKFLSPCDNIRFSEVANRSGTLLCLGATALTLKNALDEGAKERNYVTFSELAIRVCSEEIYQQDMPNIMREFSSRSSYHAALIRNVEKRLEQCQNAMCSISKDTKKGRPANDMMQPIANKSGSG
jgi:AbiV family abortive infection protein